LQEKYGVDIDDIDGFGGNFSTNNTFTLNEAKTFTFLVNFNQELFGTDGYSYDKPNANLSLGLRYLAFNKKLDFNLKGNDVFNQGIYKSYSTVNNIREDVTWRSFGRSIALTVRYNFGSDKVKIKQHQEGNNEEKQRAGGN
jgi:iron complex outermembrane recepter protein